MKKLADNLKVLLWKNKREFPQKTYREYIDFVAKQCRMTLKHFRAILCCEEMATDEEEARLRQYFSDYSDNLSGIRYDFLFSDLIKEGQNEILTQNLQYLLGIIKHGENAEFVAAICVNPSTLTRWKQGKTMPDKKTLEKIANYFGLKNVDELKTQLLFLDLAPVSEQQKKQECKEMIDVMGKEDFEMVYAALKKLLK